MRRSSVLESSQSFASLPSFHLSPLLHLSIHPFIHSSSHPFISPSFHSDLHSSPPPSDPLHLQMSVLVRVYICEEEEEKKERQIAERCSMGERDDDDDDGLAPVEGEEGSGIFLPGPKVKLFFIPPGISNNDLTHRGSILFTHRHLHYFSIPINTTVLKICVKNSIYLLCKI